jgi:cold shock CspA family protein
MYSAAIRRCLVSARSRSACLLSASARTAFGNSSRNSVRYYRAAVPLQRSSNNDDDMNRINSSISSIISNNISDNSSDDNDAKSSDHDASIDETTHGSAATEEIAIDDTAADTDGTATDTDDSATDTDDTAADTDGTATDTDDTATDTDDTATDTDDTATDTDDAATDGIAIDATEVATSQDNSTDTSKDDSNGSNAEPKYATGTVKFYHRERLFGFISMDKAPRGTKDIFVQRSHIRSHLDFAYSPRNPFLLRGDRVRFALEEVDGQLKAMDVTALDRRPIPPLRHSYWRNKHQGLNRQLGEDVATIMRFSPDDQWQRIQDAWKVHQARMEDASVLMQRLGMNQDDFAPSKENKTLNNDSKDGLRKE